MDDALLSPQRTLTTLDAHARVGKHARAGTDTAIKECKRCQDLSAASRTDSTLTFTYTCVLHSGRHRGGLVQLDQHGTRRNTKHRALSGVLGAKDA